MTDILHLFRSEIEVVFAVFCPLTYRIRELFGLYRTEYEVIHCCGWLVTAGTVVFPEERQIIIAVLSYLQTGGVYRIPFGFIA